MKLIVELTKNKYFAFLSPQGFQLLWGGGKTRLQRRFYPNLQSDILSPFEGGGKCLGLVGIFPSPFVGEGKCLGLVGIFPSPFVGEGEAVLELQGESYGFG